MFSKIFFYHCIFLFLLTSSFQAFSGSACEVLAFSEHRLALAGNDNGNGNGGNFKKTEEAALAIRRQMQIGVGEKPPFEVESSRYQSKMIHVYTNILEGASKRIKEFATKSKRLGDLDNDVNKFLDIWLVMVMMEIPRVRRIVIGTIIRSLPTLPIKIDDFTLAIRSLPDKYLDRFPFSELPVETARLILSEMSDTRLLSLVGVEVLSNLPFTMLKERMQNTSPGRLNKAYESAGREWHPSRNSNPEAGERFAKITNAYNQLHKSLYRSRQTVD